MASFEENLSMFESTTRGNEMRESLHECFNYLRIELTKRRARVDDLDTKIKDIENGGEQNA